MDDIQNDQKTAQKADTDLEKAIVPSAHSNQQIESKKESSPNSKVEQPTPDSASAVETDPKSPAKSISPSNQNDGSRDDKIIATFCIWARRIHVL